MDISSSGPGSLVQPAQETLGELRILLIHNRDFPAEGSETAADVQDRADVANVAQRIARTLVARGHFVEVLGVDSEDLGSLLDRIRADRPDLVFNLCESLSSTGRNEIVVPALLDLLGVCYSGSGAMTLGLCVQKHRTKQILRAAGIPSPLGVALPARPRSRFVELEETRALGYPLFVKLVHEDASVGISQNSVVHTDEQLLRQVDYLRTRYQQPVLVEQYIGGREIYVAMLGNQPRTFLPLWEIDFSKLPAGLPPIVTYEGKWNPSSPECVGTPSVLAMPLSPELEARIVDVARRTFEALEVTDYGRCDIRLAEDGTPYVIDVNPNCDLAEQAGFARASAHIGISYDQMIEQIAHAALERSTHAHVRVLDPAARRPPSPTERPRAALQAGGNDGRLLGRGSDLRPRAHRQRMR